MKIRTSCFPFFKNKNEHGVICKCGLCLFFNEKDLTPPMTIVTCPICKSTICYHSNRSYNQILSGKKKK